MDGAQRFSDPIGLRLAPRRDHEVDLHLEVVRADRHFEPLGLSPGLRDDAGDRGLGQPEEAQNAVRGILGAREDLLELGPLERGTPDALQLAGRPGKGDRQRRAGLE
jgi:hypothetical protein